MRRLVLGILLGIVFLTGAIAGDPMIHLISQVVTPIPQPVVRLYDSYNSTYSNYGTLT
ncbi:MAG: hypothetical protein RXS23_08240 [Metallosphaera yellowstonensis]|jgi:hypothetical protein